MKTLKTISIHQFCTHYDVPVSFIEELNEYDLIRFSIINKSKHIDLEQVNKIERLIRLHYHLNINFEGLDVVLNLLNRVDHLQTEINSLHNKINFLSK